MTDAQERFVRLIVAGGVPRHLMADAYTMATRPHPPPWRPLKRHRWNRSAKRVLDWAGVKTKWSWFNFMWEVVP